MTSRARTEKRGIAADDGHERARQQDAEHGAGSAEHEALGEQRPPKRAGAGAECGSCRELRFRVAPSAPNQVRHVGAGDHEDDASRREQQSSIVRAGAVI